MVLTLTQTANLTKRLMLFMAIFLVLSISLWAGFRYYYQNVYLPSIPPPEPKADLKFGKLPKISFPEASASATNYSYVLDTVTGDLPDKIPKLMKIYFVPLRLITLLDPDKGNNLAKGLGFPLGPQVISPTQFKYTDSDGGELVLDLNSGNFRFKKNVNQTDLTPGNLPSGSKIEADFKAYLSRFGLVKGQLSGGRTKAIYNQGLVKDSFTATVSIWPTDLEEYQIVTPQFSSSLVRALVRNGENDESKYLTLDYTYWEIDKKTFATYPIKSVSDAYSDLKRGNSYIIFAPDSAQVSLRNIYLAYYQPEEYVPYIQPVFIFEGENFVAYVSAVKGEYTEN